MLTTMDTLDSLERSSPGKEGEVEQIEPLPPPAPSGQAHATSTFLLSSLPSRLGALWASPDHGEALALSFQAQLTVCICTECRLSGDMGTASVSPGFYLQTYKKAPDLCEARGSA